MIGVAVLKKEVHVNSSLRRLTYTRRNRFRLVGSRFQLSLISHLFRIILKAFPPETEIVFFSAPYFFFSFFFARIGRSDLTKKLEKVGPFECDELEKHCRVSAKCYPTKVPALYTMTKEKFNAVCLVLLLVSRLSKSQLLGINELVSIVHIPRNSRKNRYNLMRK